MKTQHYAALGILSCLTLIWSADKGGEHVFGLTSKQQKNAAIGGLVFFGISLGISHFGEKKHN